VIVTAQPPGQAAIASPTMSASCTWARPRRVRAPPRRCSSGPRKARTQEYVSGAFG